MSLSKAVLSVEWRTGMPATLETTFCGNVAVKVIGYDSQRKLVQVKVTARKNRHYSPGEILVVHESNVINRDNFYVRGGQIWVRLHESDFSAVHPVDLPY